MESGIVGRLCTAFVRACELILALSPCHLFSVSIRVTMLTCKPSQKRYHTKKACAVLWQQGSHTRRRRFASQRCSLLKSVAWGLHCVRVGLGTLLLCLERIWLMCAVFDCIVFCLRILAWIECVLWNRFAMREVRGVGMSTTTGSVGAPAAALVAPVTLWWQVGLVQTYFFLLFAKCSFKIIVPLLTS